MSAVLRPSSAHRWMECPGSVRLEQGIPDTASTYAAEGTAAHHVAAEALRGRDVTGLVGQTVEGVEITPEMVEHAQEYAATVLSLAGTSGVVMIEQRLEISVGDTVLTGTADALVYDGETVRVVDYKYGRGEIVSADDNPQLLLYAGGAVHTFGILFGDAQVFHLLIVQPRAGGVRETYVSRDVLSAFLGDAEYAQSEVQGALAASDDSLPHYLRPAAKACHWCRAKAICPALQAEVARSVGLDFDDLTEPLPVEARQPHDLAQAMGAVDLIEAWCTSVREEVRRRLLDGEGVPGWKLVEGRKGARKWNDESEAQRLLEQALGAEAWERKIVSPTTAEKKLKKSPAWQAVAGLVTQPEGAPVVAPLSDRRTEWAPVSFDIV